MDKSILEKIQKLAAKAESAKELGNINEAAAFSAKVSELLTIHNLAMSDLDFEERAPVKGEKLDDLGVSASQGRWTVSLLSVLCEYNFCGSMFHTTTLGSKIVYGRRGPKRVRIKDKNLAVTIVGRPENVEVVKYLYSVLKRQFESMAYKEWKVYLKDIRAELMKKYPDYTCSDKAIKTPWKYFTGVSNRAKYTTSFFKGAVIGVRTKLSEQQRKANEVHGAKITDLVLVNTAEVDAWMANEFPDAGQFQSRKSKVDGNAFRKGQEAGRNASMAKGVSTGDSVATKMIQ